MRQLSLRNRWVSHVVCVALGAALATGGWLGAGAQRDSELGDRVSGRRMLDIAHTDPEVVRVEVECRPDGTFETRQARKDGSVQVVEHARWRVSGGRLVQGYASHDGRPVPSGTPARPVRFTVARADQTLVLVWPVGAAEKFRRAEG